MSDRTVPPGSEEPPPSASGADEPAASGHVRAGEANRPQGLLDPDEYGSLSLSSAPPAVGPSGAEVISLTGHRIEPAPSPAADSIVESDEGVLEPPPERLLQSAIEAMLLAADGPVSLHVLNGWLGDPGERIIRDHLRSIAARLLRDQHGWRLVEVAKGWQLRTDVRFSRWVARMRGGRPQRLSTAAMDVLAIVAYRQPCTRAEVDHLRGVDSGGVLRLLCERGLAAVMGRKEVPGRPLLYGTTKNFLSLFGLRDLSELPTLRDLRELRQEEERLPPGAAELLGISPEQLGRALGLTEDEEAGLASHEAEGTQTHLFEVVDPETADLDDEAP